MLRFRVHGGDHESKAMPICTLSTDESGNKQHKKVRLTTPSTSTAWRNPTTDSNPNSSARHMIVSHMPLQLGAEAHGSNPGSRGWATSLRIVFELAELLCNERFPLRRYFLTLTCPRPRCAGRVNTTARCIIQYNWTTTISSKVVLCPNAQL